jgi:WD40 repeat protein
LAKSEDGSRVLVNCLGQNLYVYPTHDFECEPWVYGGAMSDSFWVRGDLSEDGRSVVCGSSTGEIRVWDDAAPQPSAIISEHESEVSIALWQQDQLLTVADDNQCCLWQLDRSIGNCSNDERTWVSRLAR